MESKQDPKHLSPKHLSEAEWAAFGDPALAPGVQERLSVHLDSCAVCQARLERNYSNLSSYTQCLDTVHARVPRLQQTNEALQNMLQRMETTVPGRRFSRPQFFWAAGIAASLIGAVLLSLSWNGSDLRAESFLAQASAAPVRNISHRALRIRTQNASFVRPLSRPGHDSQEDDGVRAHFLAANYDWRDPLSAQSYSDWRHTLKRKSSKVSIPDGVSQPLKQVETITSEGTLRLASLTFDASLAPVSGLFQFSDREWVQITAVPDTDPRSVADLIPAPVSAPPVAGISENGPREPLAERELDVRLAIDVLHLGASEPIEVSTGSGDILVTTYHLTAEQEQKLTASLQGIQGVHLRAANNTAANNAIETQRFADATGLLLQASQDFSAEAHFLAELAVRFSPATEATLSQQARGKLMNLRSSHARELTSNLARLQQQLEAASPNFRASEERGPASAVGRETEDLAKSAAEVDRLVTLLSATPESERAPLWPQISSEFVRSRSLAKDYSRVLAR